MSINKFGTLLANKRANAVSDNDTTNHFIRDTVALRNFIHDRAILRSDEEGIEDYDARERKVRRLAKPVNDTDAVNKLYMDNEINKAKGEFLRDMSIALTNVASETYVERSVANKYSAIFKKIEELKRELNVTTENYVQRLITENYSMILKKIEELRNELNKNIQSLNSDVSNLDNTLRNELDKNIKSLNSNMQKLEKDEDWQHRILAAKLDLADKKISHVHETLPAHEDVNPLDLWKNLDSNLEPHND